jgi:uncharacterized protein
LEKNFKRVTTLKLLQFATIVGAFSKVRKMSHIIINGPAGNLETRFDLSTHATGKSAILCHPHPQYGGSMHDAVLQTATDVFLAHGIHCLRFNFRGVGASAGHFDHGAGEVEDLMAVHKWLSQQHTEDEIVWLGYSFGAAMVWQALQYAVPAGVVLVAPPIGMMDFTSAAPSELNMLTAIAGDRDDFVDANKFSAWEGVKTHTISGADHFFSGTHGALADVLAKVVSNSNF